MPSCSRTSSALSGQVRPNCHCRATSSQAPRRLGDFLDTIDDRVDVDADPDSMNTCECASCGAQAVWEDDEYEGPFRAHSTRSTSTTLISSPTTRAWSRSCPSATSWTDDWSLVSTTTANDVSSSPTPISTSFRPSVCASSCRPIARATTLDRWRWLGGRPSRSRRSATVASQSLAAGHLARAAPRAVDRRPDRRRARVQTQLAQLVGPAARASSSGMSRSTISRRPARLITPSRERSASRRLRVSGVVPR